LNIPEETTFGQYSDHRGIARFDSQDDVNFQRVLNSLKTLAEDIEEQSRRNPVKSLELTSASTGKCPQKFREVVSPNK
jgi:hypothetical protein